MSSEPKGRMWLAVRWLITSALFHGALGYAAFTACRSNATLHVLKLWMILGTLLALSYIGGEAVAFLFPIYYEIRCIATWCLLMLEPRAWSTLYDAGYGPISANLDTLIASLRKTRTLKVGYIRFAVALTWCVQAVVRRGQHFGWVEEGAADGLSSVREALFRGLPQDEVECRKTR